MTDQQVESWLRVQASNAVNDLIRREIESLAKDGVVINYPDDGQPIII